MMSYCSDTQCFDSGGSVIDCMMFSVKVLSHSYKLMPLTIDLKVFPPECVEEETRGTGWEIAVKMEVAIT